MLGGDVFEGILKEAPVCVMARATLEAMFAPEALDQLFRRHAKVQYERELLFSSVVDLMCLVVTRVVGSVHAAVQRRKEQLTVAAKSVYNKLNGIEPGVSREVVRHSAKIATPVIDRLGGKRPLLKGYRVLVLDGNKFHATDHRLKELRQKGGAPLPGIAVAVLDPQRRLIQDVVVAEDAYVQETQLVAPILQELRPKDLVIADRMYCTSDILFEIAHKKACFIIRQHTGHLRYELRGRCRCRGRTVGGKLYEQEADLIHPQTGEILRVRLISVRLDQPTRDGDTELHLFTNLPAKAASAEVVANLYRQRWTVETAFQEMTTHQRCEISALGYPPAACFTFCMAAACYNAFAVIHAALRAAHGEEVVDTQVSSYYLTDELAGTYRGMMIALPPAQWVDFQTLTPTQLATHLKRWAQGVKLSRYQKHPRGPKLRSQRPFAGSKHFATARVLDPSLAKARRPKKRSTKKQMPP